MRRNAGSLAGVNAPPPLGGKPQFPEMYQFLNTLLATRSVPPGGVTGTTNTSPGEWVFFDFQGKSGTGVSVRWRLRDHWVELVLPADGVERRLVEEALADQPLPGATVAIWGTSALVVWIPVAEVDPFAPPEPQRPAVEQAVTTADVLARWFAASRHLYM